MSLWPIVSRPQQFFQLCQITATEDTGPSSDPSLHRLFTSQEKISCAEFDEVRKKHPNILTISFESQTVISHAINTNNQELIDYISRMGDKEIFEVGKPHTGETALFSACQSLNGILGKLIVMGSNVNRIAFPDGYSLPPQTVLESYIKNVSYSPSSSFEKQGLKLLLSRGACVQNPPELTEEENHILYTVCQEFSDEMQRVCKIAKQVIALLETFPTVLHTLVMDYVINRDEVSVHYYIKSNKNKYNQPPWFTGDTIVEREPWLKSCLPCSLL